jgi:predicted  nucleic acid-binding Zn-ribbon protein
MKMDETLIKNKVLKIEFNIAKINDRIKKLKKCIEISKKEGITEIELKPLFKKYQNWIESKQRLEGELHNIYHICNHDFTIIETQNILFGIEVIFQCKKCGYTTTKMISNK